MAVRFCPTHGIGYNPDLDPVCPQCSVGRIQPPPALEVDLNPTSDGYGHPKQPGGLVGDRSLRNVLGR